MNYRKKKFLFTIACLLGINGVFGAVAMDKNVKYDKMKNFEQKIQNNEFKYDEYKNILAKYGEELKKGGRVEEFENEYAAFLKKHINFVKNSKLEERLKNNIKYVETQNSSKPKIKATYKGIRKNFLNLSKDLLNKLNQDKSLMNSMTDTYNLIKPYIEKNNLYKIPDCEFNKIANEFAGCINSFSQLVNIENDLLMCEAYHHDIIQFSMLLGKHIEKFKKILNSSNIESAKHYSKTYKDFNRNIERFNICIEKIKNIRNRNTIDFVEGNLDENLQLLNQIFEQYKNLYNEINSKNEMQTVEIYIKKIEDEINKYSKKLTNSNFSLEEIKNCINCTKDSKKNLKTILDKSLNEILKDKIYTLLNEIDKIQNLAFKNINKKIETNISKLKNEIIPKLEKQKKCDGYEEYVAIQKDIDEAKNLVVDLEAIEQEMPDLTKLEELNSLLLYCENLSYTIEKNYFRLNTIYDELQNRSAKFESLNKKIDDLRKELETDITKKPKSDLENELEAIKNNLKEKTIDERARRILDNELTFPYITNQQKIINKEHKNYSKKLKEAKQKLNSKERNIEKNKNILSQLKDATKNIKNVKEYEENMDYYDTEAKYYKKLEEQNVYFFDSLTQEDENQLERFNELISQKLALENFEDDNMNDN